MRYSITFAGDDYRSLAEHLHQPGFIEQGASIVSVQGRVTTLLPGAACLFCRGRITAEGVRAQVIESCNPEQAKELRRQQYAPELEGNAPAVIAFTSAVASTAVSELLHRLPVNACGNSFATRPSWTGRS
jgi:hypothetical protein